MHDDRVPDELAHWLSTRGLDHLTAILATHAIGLDVLPNLSQAEMERIGIPLGDALRLHTAAKTWVAQLGPSALHGAPLCRDVKGLVQTESNQVLLERRQVTVLFCDLVGSTQLSLQLDAEDYRTLLQKYQHAVVETMERFGGYIARFLGDGLLVYFGYPTADENAAARAIYAALAVTAKVEGILDDDGAPLRARVGIATGEVVSGDVLGHDTSKTRPLIGSTLNLAARLQAIAEPGTVMVSDTTLKLSGLSVESQTVRLSRLKGFSTEIMAHRVHRAFEPEPFHSPRADAPTPFVGRREELRRLMERLKRAKMGNAQVVLLTGEPGIGKSRLVSEFINDAQASSTVWTWSCSPFHRNSTFFPLYRFLNDQLVGAQSNRGKPGDARAWAGFNGDGVPVEESLHSATQLSSLFPIGNDSQVAATGRDFSDEISKAWLDMVRCHAKHSPCVLVIEDLHWADPSTLSLLILSIDELRHDRVLIVTTSRLDQMPTIPKTDHCSVINIDRLSLHESMLLVEHVCKGSGVDAIERERIVDRCDGIPLFIEEVTRELYGSML